MKKLLSLFAGLFLVTTLSFAGNYQVNDEKIDGLFEQASEKSILEFYNITESETSGFSSAFSINEIDKGTLALIVLAAGWVTGLNAFIMFFGIHRIIMGSSGKVALLYCITLGGIFYIVPIIDFIMLIINVLDDKGAGTYENNDKFFGFN